MPFLQNYGIAVIFTAKTPPTHINSEKYLFRKEYFYRVQYLHVLIPIPLSAPEGTGQTAGKQQFFRERGKPKRKKNVCI